MQKIENTAQLNEMTAEGELIFERQPGARDAIRLRSSDDQDFAEWVDLAELLKTGYDAAGVDEGLVSVGHVKITVEFDRTT